MTYTVPAPLARTRCDVANAVALVLVFGVVVKAQNIGPETFLQIRFLC
jgi:hypothetical protein